MSTYVLQKGTTPETGSNSLVATFLLVLFHDIVSWLFEMKKVKKECVYTSCVTKSDCNVGNIIGDFVWYRRHIARQGRKNNYGRNGHFQLIVTLVLRHSMRYVVEECICWEAFNLFPRSIQTEFFPCSIWSKSDGAKYNEATISKYQYMSLRWRGGRYTHKVSSIKWSVKIGFVWGADSPSLQIFTVEWGRQIAVSAVR